MDKPKKIKNFFSKCHVCRRGSQVKKKGGGGAYITVLNNKSAVRTKSFLNWLKRVLNDLMELLSHSY